MELPFRSWLRSEQKSYIWLCVSPRYTTAAPTKDHLLRLVTWNAHKRRFDQKVPMLDELRFGVLVVPEIYAPGIRTEKVLGMVMKRNSVWQWSQARNTACAHSSSCLMCQRTSSLDEEARGARAIGHRS
jgi:hypothetical protein